MKGPLLALALLFAVPIGAHASVAPDAARDPFEMSVERLMDVEVTTVSTFAQSDGSSAVTVIAAADIRDYGYRTLAEALRSIRGVYLTYDRIYDYFGVRALSRSGDYNWRLLPMIDGHRVNDVIYDQAFIGTDGLIDMEDVAPMVFVPGPGSALYGNNAFFGVVNLITEDGITKVGKDVGGAALSGGFGSFGTDRESVSCRFGTG